jgi:hypothetical protein
MDAGRVLRPAIIQNGLKDAFASLTASMEILKSPVKTHDDIGRAALMLEAIPFQRDTARLYELFLAPDKGLLNANEKAEVLEGFHLILQRYRNRENPSSAHLAQRSAHWMARSGEDKFAQVVEGLYQDEKIPLVKRGMMMGLIFSNRIEPDEYLHSFLKQEPNRLLEILTYQMRCKDAPYALDALMAKDVKISRNFERTLEVLLKELKDLQNKPARLCSLHTLNNVLALGREKALTDFKTLLATTDNRLILNMLLSQDGWGSLWRAELKKLKQWLRVCA